VNLVEFVFQAAREMNRWSETAILYEDRSLSYEQLFRLVKRFGAMVAALGVKPLDRVAIAAADCPEWIISFLGTTGAGAVAVPVSTMLSAAELRYVLDHCGAKALVVTPEQLEKLQGIRDELPQIENVLTERQTAC
jgi:acyl-CoA synthetase (AMP-forming)/AMP-acid ligase II